MKPDTNLFSLKPGDQFMNYDNVHEVVKFTRERLPRFGVVDICNTKNVATGEPAKWITNWKIIDTPIGYKLVSETERP